MFGLLVLAGKVMLVAITATALAVGAMQAGDGMSRYSSAARTVEDRFHDESTDMDEIQRARTEGMCDAVVGTAKVAAAAQTIASPDLPKNWVGLGFTDAMTIAQTAIEQHEGSGEQGTTAGDSSANVSLMSPADAQAAAAAGTSGSGDGGGTGAAASPDGGVPVEQARENYYIAWYCKDFGWEPIYITTVKRFRTDELAYTYPGGGIDPSVPLVKVALTGAFATEEEARKSVYGMMNNPRLGGGIYAGLPLADIGGKTHSLEFCGGLEWWQ